MKIIEISIKVLILFLEKENRSKVGIFFYSFHIYSNFVYQFEIDLKYILTILFISREKNFLIDNLIIILNIFEFYESYY